MAASVGRWFICLSLGLSSAHASWSLVSWFLYSMKSARVAVAWGMGRWGLIGTGCMTGLLEVSRTGVLLGKDFDKGVKSCQVDVPASMISMEALQFASSFFGILLGVWSKLVEQALLHDAIMGHDIGCRRGDILDGPLEICNYGLGQELVMSCDSLGEILCKQVPVFLEFVLFFLSCFVD